MPINSPNFEMKRGAMLFSWLSFILQIVTKNTFFLLSTFLMANGGILLLLLGNVFTSNVVKSKASPRPFLGKRWWCTTLPSVPVLIWAASHVNLHLLIFYLLISHLLILHLLSCSSPIHHFSTIQRLDRPVECRWVKLQSFQNQVMQTKVIDYDWWKGKVFVLKLSTSWIPCSSLSSRYSAIWSRNSEVTNIPG